MYAFYMSKSKGEKSCRYLAKLPLLTQCCRTVVPDYPFWTNWTILDMKLPSNKMKFFNNKIFKVPIFTGGNSCTEFLIDKFTMVSCLSGIELLFKNGSPFFYFNCCIC